MIQKQAKIKNDTKSTLGEMFTRRLTEGVFIIITSLAVFLLLAFTTYHQSDPGWSQTGQHEQVMNAAGKAGAWFADFFLYIFGYFAYLFPLAMIYSAWRYLGKQHVLQFHFPLIVLRAAGFLLLLSAGCGLAALLLTGHEFYLPYTAGGIIGNLVAHVLDNSFNFFGASILLFALLLAGTTLFAGVSWLTVIEYIGWAFVTLTQHVVFFLADAITQLKQKVTEKIGGKLAVLKANRAAKREAKLQEKAEKLQEKAKSKQLKEAIKRRKLPPEKPVDKKEPQIVPIAEKPIDNTPIIGDFPTVDLLEKSLGRSQKGFSNAQLEQMSREVEQRLMDFGVDVQVVAVHPGPVITRFELQLAPGIKVSKITGLAKDLARSLSVTSVRVVEVIPGKPVVGIELPNDHREIVRLHEVLSSQQYTQARSAVSLALGVDIAGHPVIVDLAKMPHLLVAGTTGSGKSVGINAMLLSILYKASPEEVRMILIDPKMLELSVYSDIPHLLAPVVTDMKDAANALRWAVAEMERRYRLMAAMGVRNLQGFNQLVEKAQHKGQTIIDPLWNGNPEFETPPELTKLPFIVVVIDELADMMMVVGKKVEQLIARIAQKARAAGIHLILATQRPSVDVLTGLIKSNVPTRMSFQVSSKIDSRTILDQQGAETLLGHGDMLYLAPGTGTPVRVHGAFVDDNEVHKVASDWKRRGKPNYLEAITSGASEDGEPLYPEESGDVEDTDELYDQVVEFVVDSGKASISGVQRRFRIGYNRAARLIEELERTGLVGPLEGGSRDVRVPKE